jgi:hypothetical protein
MLNKRREHTEHFPVDAETFEEWRANFMKEQTDEGEPPRAGGSAGVIGDGNIATAIIGG